MFTSIDPATGTQVASYASHGEADVERRLSRAESAGRAWRATPLEDRTSLLRAFGEALVERREEFAQLMTREMGKPIVQSRAEIDKSAFACRHYAEAAAGYLAPEPVMGDASGSHVRFDPMGTVFAIMPWNFPFWQVIRFLAPITSAGNVVVLKHAPATMGCGEAIAELAADVGYPLGVVQTLRVDHEGAAEVIADRRVHAVTFTGSTRGGRHVGALAGANNKKSVLELGGSDAFIVLDDADVEAAAETAVTSRLMNNGQSCVCAKRFLVVSSVAEEFTQAVAARMETAVVGHPNDETTQVGPLARADLRDVLADQIGRSVAAGAKLAVPGGTLDGAGYYFAPALLTEVTLDHAAANEETFGPVATISVVADHREAIATANASEYGLGAAVWTGDPELALEVAAELEAGVVAINDMVRSDPRLPFGGVKSSGYGRELGAFGLREFTNIKSVHVAG
jgi:succinate-semialdehyde dehydrogenase / glutarate-semialdehyde dehydrogenase